jgi:hypothetical protein
VSVCRRDWNEDYQNTREMPIKDVHDKLLRAKILHKVGTHVYIYDLLRIDIYTYNTCNVQSCSRSRQLHL